MSESRFFKMNENDLTTGLTERLRYYIQTYRNDEAKSLLRQLLRIRFNPSRNSNDTLGPLLLHAVNYNNYKIIKHLIDLGVDVEYTNAMLYNYKTPLMIGVLYAFEESVNVLLKANANLEAKNPEGLTVLQMIFDSSPTLFPLLISDELTELVLTRVKAGNNDIEALVDKLMAAGCTLFHAPYLKNLQIIECMLNRGLDINYKWASQKRTILHTAVALGDSNLIIWLLDRGADVNALDAVRDSPLHLVDTSSFRIMEILLKCGADPNISNRYGETALTKIFLSHSDSNRECLQLLFDYGAIPQNALIDSYLQPMLEIAFSMKMYFKIDMMIDYLAVLKMNGNPAAQSFLRYNEDISNYAVVQRRLELCEKNLKCKRFGKLSMFELLTDSERKMRVHARNVNLVSELQEFCSSDENRKMFPYYCFTLGLRISKAARLVKLENAAIPTICKIINGNYNKFYIPARYIVGNLNENDLRLLTSM